VTTAERAQHPIGRQGQTVLDDGSLGRTTKAAKSSREERLTRGCGGGSHRQRCWWAWLTSWV